MGAIALGLLLLPFGYSRRARKRLGKLSIPAVLLCVALSTMVLTGCGSNHGFFRQQSHDYTLTVTAISGSVHHVATITLNIQ
jgi:multisubunit Na+/H+ antiporter MnhB subunit